jgi:hypothetical protein
VTNCEFRLDFSWNSDLIYNSFCLTTRYCLFNKCLLQFIFKIQAPLKLPCETIIDYPGNNQLHKIIFYNSIIVNTACFYYLEALVIAILPLCFVIIWSRDVSDDTLVELSYMYAVNAYHSLSLWVRLQYMTRLFYTTFCDKDCQWHRTARLFFTELVSIYTKM